MRSTDQILTDIKRVGQKNPLTKVQSRLEKGAGLGDLQAGQRQVRESILNTQRLLKETPTNVQMQSRRLGGPVTAAQTARLTSVAQQPLAQQLSDFSATEQAGAQNIADVRSSIDRQLALKQQRRETKRQNLLTELGLAQQAEARYAAQAQASAAQREQEKFLRDLAAAQMGGSTGGIGEVRGGDVNTGVGIVKGPAQRFKDIDFLTNNAIGRTGTELIGGIREGLGLTGTGALTQAISNQGQMTGKLGEIKNQAVLNFLVANPQYQGQGINTVDKIIQLQRQGYKINPFQTGARSSFNT